MMHTKHSKYLHNIATTEFEFAATEFEFATTEFEFAATEFESGQVCDIHMQLNCHGYHPPSWMNQTQAKLKSLEVQSRTLL